MARETQIWHGKSGKEYVYHIRENEEFPAAAGNYIFAKKVTGGWEAIYVGESKDLQDRLVASHEKLPCCKRNGYTHIMYHKNGEGVDARRREEKDIVDRWNPPCND